MQINNTQREHSLVSTKTLVNEHATYIPYLVLLSGKPSFDSLFSLSVLMAYRVSRRELVQYSHTLVTNKNRLS